MSGKATDWALEVRGIRLPARGILQILCAHHNYKTNQCNPSIPTLCEESGLKRRAVLGHLQTLEKAGLIKRQTESLGRARGKSTTYTLNMSILEAVQVSNNDNLQVQENARAKIYRCKNSHLQVQKNAPAYNKEEPEENRNIKTSKKSLPEATAVFEHYRLIAAQTDWRQAKVFSDRQRSAANARVKTYGLDGVKEFLSALARERWTFEGWPGNENFRATLTYVLRARTFDEHFDKLMAGAESTATNIPAFKATGRYSATRQEIYTETATGREFVFTDNGREYLETGGADVVGLDGGGRSGGKREARGNVSDDMSGMQPKTQEGQRSLFVGNG